MGLTELGLGRWSAAWVDLQAALAVADDPWIVHNHRALASAFGVVREHVGRLMVVGGPAGAEVLFNTHAVGALPMTEAVPVDAGTGALVVRRPGFIEARRSVNVPVDGEARESVDLVEEAPPCAPEPAVVQAPRVQAPRVQAPAPVIIPVAPRVELPVAVPVPVPVSPAAPTGMPTTRVLGLAAGGTALAFMVLGIYGMARRSDAVDGFNGNARCVGPLDDRTYGDCATLRGTADSDRSQGELLEAVGFGMAGALAATAVVLLAWPPRPPDTERPTAALRCGQGPGRVGLACGATF